MSNDHRSSGPYISSDFSDDPQQYESSQLEHQRLRGIPSAEERLGSSVPRDRFQSSDEAPQPQIETKPQVRKESQGSQTVNLPEVNLNLPLYQRPAEALRLAQEAFTQTGYWVSFFRAILGSNGVVSKLFPKAEELDYFHETDEFAEIQKILTALRTSDVEKADAVEPLRMITIRIPRSLQSALIDEAKLHETSINKLCISKLLCPIKPDLIPVEQGKVKGRKPRA